MNPFYAWLWRMQKRGSSLDDLADMTGLSRDKINRCIRQHRWDRGEVVMSARQLTQAYVIEGKSIQAIADQYYCSYGAVYGHLERYGIPRRPRGNITYCKNTDNTDCKRVTQEQE